MTINVDVLKRIFLCRLGFHGLPIGGVEILKYEGSFNTGRMLRYRAFAKCARCHKELPNCDPVPEVTAPTDGELLFQKRNKRL